MSNVTLRNIERVVKQWGDPIVIEDITEVWGVTEGFLSLSPRLKIENGYVIYIGD